MFSVFKEFAETDEIKIFRLPLNAELELKLDNVSVKHYNYLINKYPFNKELSNDEFHQLARGVLISILTACSPEDDIHTLFDSYHVHIVKTFFIFCVTRGFHINNDFCEYLDKIIINLINKKKQKEKLWTEFNNSFGCNMPLWDDFLNEIKFVEKLKNQDIRTLNKTDMINDIKQINEDHLDLFKFFLEPHKFIDNNNNNKVNLIYKKYVKWCNKWLPKVEEVEEEVEVEEVEEEE
jgi:hypothetical protein